MNKITRSQIMSRKKETSEEATHKYEVRKIKINIMRRNSKLER